MKTNAKSYLLLIKVNPAPFMWKCQPQDETLDKRCGVKKRSLIAIGSLGNVHFHRGYYVYAGSARKGIEARLRRHLKKRKKTYWHIDYLLTKKHTEIVKIFTFSRGTECELSKLMEKEGGIPIKGFGSSDCRKCKAHLYFLGEGKAVKKVLSTQHYGAQLLFSIHSATKGHT